MLPAIMTANIVTGGANDDTEPPSKKSMLPTNKEFNFDDSNSYESENGGKQPPPNDDISGLGSDDGGGKQQPPNDGISALELNSASPQQNHTSGVEDNWPEDFIDGDPLKQRLADQFRKDADTIDTLVAQISALEEESKHKRSSGNSITSHYSTMKNDYTLTQKEYADAKAKSDEYCANVNWQCLER